MNIDISTFKKRVTVSEKLDYVKRSMGWSGIVSSLFGFAALVILGVLAIVQDTTGRFDEQGLTWAETAFAIVLYAVLITTLRLNVLIKRGVRLQRFSHLNNMDLYTGPLLEPKPGAIFSLADAQYFDMLFTAKDGSLEFGNIKYPRGVFKRSLHGGHGFVSMRLSRQFPDVLFYSKLNKQWHEGAFSKPEGYRSSGVLGDKFSQAYRVLVPDGQEAHLLSLLDSELLQLVVDHAHEYDFEVIGDRLYIYRTSFYVGIPEHISETVQLANKFAGMLNSQPEVGRYMPIESVESMDSKLILPKRKPKLPMAARVMFGVMLLVIIGMSVTMVVFSIIPIEG